MKLSALKICVAEDKEKSGGEIRRLDVYRIVLKADEFCGIIKYRNLGGNHAYLHIHIKRKIRIGRKA